jgi:hypothetical protein
MQNRILINYLIFIVIIHYIGCASSEKTDYGSDAYLIKGTMHYLDIEGDCWQFTTKDDDNYELIGSDVERLHHDGIRAELIVRDLPEYVSTCMIGKPVQVLEIILISP